MAKQKKVQAPAEPAEVVDIEAIRAKTLLDPQDVYLILHDMLKKAPSRHILLAFGAVLEDYATNGRGATKKLQARYAVRAAEVGRLVEAWVD